MAKPVAGPDADHGKLGLQDAEDLRRHGVGAAVVTDLEHVDVAERPVARQPLEHRSLRVTGQHAGGIALTHGDHGAVVVGARVVDRNRRRHDVDSQRPELERVAGDHLLDWRDIGARPRELGVSAGAAGLHKHALHLDRPREPLQPAGVIGMRVRHEHRVEPAHSIACESGADGRRVRPGVDEHAGALR